MIECEHSYVEIEKGIGKCVGCGDVSVDDKFDEIIPDNTIWNPLDRGDTIIGSIVKVDEGIYGKNYTIKTTDGKTMITPSHKLLQSILEKSKEGDEIVISYRGSKNIGKGNDLSLYKVWKKL